MIWLVLVLQVLDGLTTMRALRAGGRERNPVVAWLIDKLGFVGLWAAKAAVAAVAYAAYVIDAPYTDLCLAALAALYLIVVYKNWSLFR